MHRTTLLWGTLAAALGLAVALWLRPAAPSAESAPAASPAAAPERAGDGLSTTARAVGAGRRPLEVVVEVVRAGQPVASAHLEAWFAPPSGPRAPAWVRLAEGETAPDGTATLSLPPGELMVSAQATAEPAVVRRRAFSADDPSTRLRIELPEPMRLSGRVLREGTRAPLAGVTLRFQPAAELGAPAPPRFVAATHTDGLGRFTLLAAAPGHGELTALAPGYVTDTEFLGEPGSGDLGELLLVPAARVEGVVVNAAGAPQPSATVRAAPGTTPSVLTDAEGRFSVEVEPGSKTLDAETTAGRHGLERVLVSADAPTRGVRLVVRDGLPVDVQVVEAGSDVPAAAVEVTLASEPDGLEVGHATTGGDGQVRFEAIPQGRWMVSAWRGGARGAVLGLDLPLPSPVRLELRAAASLTGVVVDARGQPLAGADVRLAWNGQLHEPLRFARSDAQGAFALDDLLSGQVVLTATLDDGASRPQRLWIGGATPQSARLVIVGVGTVKGHVDGVTEPAAVMTLDEAEHRRFLTSPTGDFEARLPEGTYHLLAVRPRATVYRAGGQRVDVVGGRETRVTLALQELKPGDGPHLDDVGPEVGVSFENGPGGVAVSFLMHDAPAYAAGLREGDLVLGLDGEAVTNALDAFARAKGHEGQPVSWTVRREGRDLAFTVGAR